MHHHAYVYTADSIASAPIDTYLKTLSVDVRHFEASSFSINDARTLSLEAITRPIASPYKEFVICAHKIAVDAQNALLKIFEEPPAHVRFHLITPASVSLLPTLRSRLSAHTRMDTQSQPVSPAFALFARMGYAERIAEIAERAKAKDHQWMEDIVKGSETVAVRSPKLLEAVVLTRTYMGYKGSSMKMLLEHIALNLPIE